MFKKGWQGIFFGLIFLCVSSFATNQKQIRVAIIDSGLNNKSLPLCYSGHFDFTTGKPEVGKDNQIHGNEMAETINSFAKKNYCLVIYKVFDTKSATTKNITNAILMAIEDDIDIINMSMSQIGSFSRGEMEALRKALNRGIKVNVSAGNDGLDLNKICSVYPACYPLYSMNVVSARKEKQANQGKVVDQYEDFCYKDMCGTSVSSAIATGKLINNL